MSEGTSVVSQREPRIRWQYGLLLSILILIFDQLTKIWIVQQFQLYEVQAITSFFNLTLAHNPGAAFSFLANAGGWQRWFFTVIASLMSIVLLVWLYQLRQGQKFQAVAVSLILGGAIGNLWDRVTLGYVIDFLDFYWNSYHWPAFNVADSAITVGAIMLGFEMIFFKNDIKDH